MKHKKLSKAWSIAGIAVAAAVVCLVILSQSRSLGSGIGTITGTAVGAAVGSARGMTEGTSQGIADGEAEGLSAEDTTADMEDTMEAVGMLEVLVAGVTLENINEIGDTYKGLYLIDGDAVFAVDLTQAEISYSSDGKNVYILLPEPELTLYLNQSSTEKLAEIQNFSWTVNARDGLSAYLNSMTETVEKVEECLTNYDSLLETAEESAKSQVGQLVTRICTEEQSINIQFK